MDVTMATGSETTSAAGGSVAAAAHVSPLKKLTVFLIKTYREVNEVG
jgi:hypothetical protein